MLYIFNSQINQFPLNLVIFYVWEKRVTSFSFVLLFWMAYLNRDLIEGSGCIMHLRTPVLCALNMAGTINMQYVIG